jgi:uncharacterized surface protein with fasciclin (FAS1) repeats
MKNRITKLFAVLALSASITMGCDTAKSLTSASNLLGLVTKKPELSTLLSLVQTAGIGNILGGSNPLTLLAPNNDAFKALGDGALNNLMGDKSALTDVLNSHIIKGSSDLGALTGAGDVTNMLGNTLNFTGSGSNAMVDGTKILESDKTDNGYAHIIGSVLGL